METILEFFYTFSKFSNSTIAAPHSDKPQINTEYRNEQIKN